MKKYIFQLVLILVNISLKAQEPKKNLLICHIEKKLTCITYENDFFKFNSYGLASFTSKNEDIFLDFTKSK